MRCSQAPPPAGQQAATSNSRAKIDIEASGRQYSTHTPNLKSSAVAAAKADLRQGRELQCSADPGAHPKYVHNPLLSDDRSLSHAAPSANAKPAASSC